MNEEERRSFTDHINSVLGGDADIGHLLPIPTNTMQIFDEVKGECPPDKRRRHE
jgi:plastin-1